MFYVKVVPLQPIPLSREQFFTYQTDKKVKIGQLALIPLRQRQTQGIIVGFSKKPPAKKIKPISSLPLSFPLLTKTQIKLAYFVADYYCQPLGLVFKTIVPKLPKRIKKSKQFNNFNLVPLPPNDNRPISALALTADSKILVKNIKQALKQKEQVLFLLPELAQILPWQDKLAYHFPNVPLTILTGQTAKQKFFSYWQQILTGQPQIILGTRLAVFAPLAPQSLIIIYNEHNEAFKQGQMKPFYDARTIAQEYARLDKHNLFFYSPAPRISLYWQAKKEKFKIYQPKKQNIFTQTTIVDMRRELRAGNFSIFSYPLIEALKKALINRKQALFFVSRQSEYKIMICRDCGYVIACPDCHLPLVQPIRQNLLCPLCGFKQTAPSVCPNCQSTHFKNFGAGVSAVAREIEKLFPLANVQTLSPKIMAGRKSLSRLYQQFDTGQIDILVGSQAALSWRPYNLAIIALINIDSLLFAPFWTGGQQVFSLLTQTAYSYQLLSNQPFWQIIIQTYNPEHQLFRWAQLGDYKSFFKQEIKFRQALKYPPFFKIIKIQAKHANQSVLSSQAIKAMAKLRKILTSLKINPKLQEEIQIIGPTNIIKTKSGFSLNFIIKIKSENYQFYFQKAIKPFVYSLPSFWSVDVDSEKFI